MKQHASVIHLLQFQMPNTEVISASFEQSGVFHLFHDTFIDNLPPFHRILLQIQSGKNGLSHTEIWLPEKWNGILIGTGNGGMAGSIAYGALAQYLKNGYAAANSDLGTSRGEKSGINNPDVWKDFGWRATHQMTTAAKKVLLHHYKKEARYTYFVGGSTGGQQALSLAQRYPADYNGIIAGVPANNRTLLHTYFLWNHVHLRKPDGRKLFSADEIARITDIVTSFYQSKRDGCQGDSFISLPQASDQLIAHTLSYLSKKFPVLSPEQLNALRAIYSGPVNPRTGKRIYNGMPMGSEIYNCGINTCQEEDCPHFYPFIWAFGKGYSPYSFDFDRDLDQLNAYLAEDLNANDTDLSAFEQHGGKLLIYSGSADPCVPFPDAMRYYERLLHKMGGYEKVKNFCRYFLVPGRDHGDGGRGANTLESTEGKSELDILRLWYEKGVAPDSLQAVRYHQGKSDFMRTIYPYGSRLFPLTDCPPTCCEEYL